MNNEAAKHVVFDVDLIRRYDKSGPRYTSYPTAVQFQDEFGEADYRQEIRNSQQPLSLYFHLPFCNTVCFYCGCNKVVTKHRERAAPYLHRLHQEIVMQARLFGDQRTVTQLHWGGGTPTFISNEEMKQLMTETAKHFKLLDDDSGEYSIEIDPREADNNTLSLLRSIGFNRASLGVQDFDAKVQQAVNRIQPEKVTFSVLKGLRQHDFRSINLDLIYGLPFQSVKTFAETLKKVIEMDPDRLSVFNYAHLPSLFKPQRRINETDLPSAEEKLEILQLIIERLTGAGYRYIGMDHFAKPDDELAIAQDKGGLYRNFQGYSTHADCDLIAMGITAISKVGNCYSQNVRSIDEYDQALEAGHLPVLRGIVLNEDDRIRRHVITQLMCHFRLDYMQLKNDQGITFNQYFSKEIATFVEMENDGLVKLNDKQMVVLPAGRLLIRNICMVFDRYLKQSNNQRFSKVI